MRHLQARSIVFRALAAGAFGLLVALAHTPASAQAGDAPASATTLQIEVGTHAGPIRRIAVDEARDLAVTVSDDKTARVWRLSTHELLRVLRVPVGPADLGRLYGVALHPGDGSVAIGGTAHAKLGSAKRADIYVFDLNSGQLLRRFDAGRGEIKRLAWSADGALLIAGLDGSADAPPTVAAFDADGRSVLRHAVDGAVYGLAVARDGRVVATDFSGALHLFRAAGRAMQWTQRIALPSKSPVSVALSPDGMRVLVGYFAPQRPSLVALDDGRVLRSLSPRDNSLDAGYLSTVAWSPEGAGVWIAGATRLANGRVAAWRFDADSGSPQPTVDAASDSLTDLVAVPGGRAYFSSFDGSWGHIERDAVTRRVDTALADLRGAGSLRTDADGLAIEWIGVGGIAPRRFDLRRRAFAPGKADGLQGAVARQGVFGPTLQTTDAKGRLPYAMVGSTRILLENGELAISGSFLGDSKAAVIGTSRALLRVEPDGHVSQRLETGAEVNALVVTRQGTLVVSAMSDGSLRWWRAADFALVLTLLSTRDGAWIAWTPTGHYDASAGADSLAGWLVSHPEDGRAELHTLGRFRDRFMRPDVVDRCLLTLDVASAVAQAPAGEREAQRDMLAPRPAPTIAAKDAPPTLPPALSPLELPSLRSADGVVNLRFALRAYDRSPVSIVARLNGRPVEAEVELPAVLDGRAPGRVKLRVPPGVSTVHLIARSADASSDPLAFRVDMAGQATPKARLFVLAIGVADYQRSEYRLGLPAKDANDFADVMLAQRDKLYREVVVHRLRDREATREQVLKELQWVAVATQPGDVAMLFLAGHGINEPTSEYYFLPADGDLGRLARTAVPESAIRNALARVRGRAVLFVDTCYAGIVTAEAAASRHDVSRMVSELAAPENGVVVFASSTGRQESEERKAWGNGAFTKALIEGLKGEADSKHTGSVTFKGLDYHLSVEVTKLTEGRQTPVSKAPGGITDFALANL